MRQCKRMKGKSRRRGFLFVLVLLVFGVCSSAYAFEIPTCNPDWKLNWDNTLRYTLQQRLVDPDSKLIGIGNINGDDGNRNFSRGIVQNRLDIFSQADLIYKDSYGVRVSAALWYDQRYKDGLDSHDSVATSNYVHNGKQKVGFCPFVEHQYAGPYGELLDAFAFGKFNVGNVPVYLKAGRHAIVWGEVLLDPFNGINWAQAPLDLGKGTANPGTEVKELFRPLSQLSAVMQVSSELTLAAQWYMEWARHRVPEAGTYFGTTDLSQNAWSQVLILGPGFFLHHGHDITPKETKDFGVSARWSPSFLGFGTVGLYYRNVSDKAPQALLNFADYTYRFSYASDIQIFGLSYACQVFGGSVGAEVSYRKDMPLNSGLAIIYSNADLPNKGETLGARGNTGHALVNWMKLLKRTPLWDCGNYMVEFDYNTWFDVTENRNMFNGNPSYHGMNKVTKNAATIHVNFTPQWLQVLPGVDLTMPLSVGYGLWGNSSFTGGGSKEEGNYGVGFSFDIFQRHTVALNYVGYWGPIHTDPLTGAPSSRGSTALLRDRDFLSLTLKTTF